MKNEENEEKRKAYRETLLNFQLDSIKEIRISHHCNFCANLIFVKQEYNYPHIEQPIQVGSEYIIVFN